MSPRRALLLVLPLIAYVLLLAVADPVSAQSGTLDAAVPEVTSFFEHAPDRAVLREMTPTWPIEPGEPHPTEATLAQAGFRVNPAPAADEPTYTISGTVRDWNGAPQAHFWVIAYGDDRAYMQEFQSAAGEYALRVIAGAYEVGVWEGNWPRPASQRVAVPPDTSGVDFVFPQRHSISGSVRDQTGAPLINVQVTAWQASQEIASARTDAAGRYEFVVAAGAYKISASILGLEPPLRSVTVPPDAADVDFTFAEVHTISGTVRDWDGTPLTGAWINTIQNSIQYALAATDSTGAYTLTVGAGAYELTVRSGALAPPPPRTVTVPPDATGVDFTFPQRYVITGTVFDWDGTPMAGAGVRMIYRPDQGMDFYARTDVNGAYTLAVPAGAYQVYAFKDRLPAAPPRTVSVPPDVGGLDFILPARYTITGTVRDDAGAPVENAVVSIVDTTSDPPTAYSDAAGVYTLTVGAGTYEIKAWASGAPWLGPRSVIVPPNAAGIDFALPPRHVIRGIVRDWDGSPLQGVSVATTSPDPIVATAVTDATGAYTLTVVAGVHQIKASKADLPSPPARAVSVSSDVFGIDFDFPRPYTIAGTVSDWDGTPVQWARVAAFGNGEHTETRVGDPTGAYTLAVSAGSYVVSIYHQGWPAPPSQQVTVPPDKAGVHFAFPQRYTIAGKVTSHEGAPVAYSNITIYRDGQWFNSTTTNNGGFYTFLVAAGTYEVRFGSTSRSVTAPPSVWNVDFVLPPTYTIRGTVRDWDGSPLAAVEVATAGDAVVYARANTDAAGAYTLTVTAGRFTISPRIPGVLSQPKQTVIVPPDATGIDFTAPQRHTIRGVVRDFDGATLADARVEALNSSKEYDVAVTRTDAAGAYTLTLVPGDYSIRATQQGLPPPPDQDVTVPPDVTGLDFTFPQRYTISGIVRDWDGTPLAGVDVYTSGSGFYYHTYAKTNWAGVYTLTVKAGAYRVWSYNYRGLPNPEPITVTVPPSISGADITLPQRYTISGMVRKSDGSPVSGARVRTGNLDPFYSSYDTAADGVYTLTVKAGVYHVAAALDSLKTTEQIITVPPAAAGVDFTLPTYYRISGTVRDWDGKPMQSVSIQTGVGDPLLANASTDWTGHYELRAPPGVYHVSAASYGRPAPAAQTITTPPDVGEVDFVFPRTYTIRGTVRDHEGFPVRNAEVSADGDTASTASDGSYTLVVTAGRWLVRATKDSVPAQTERRVEVPPDATGVDFALPPPPEIHAISGTVRDQYGNPVAGASVYGGTSTGTTAADGAYTITAPAGEHYISARKDGYQNSEHPLVLLPPDAHGVDLVLQIENRALQGRVTDEAGRPLAGVGVEAVNAICDGVGGGVGRAVPGENFVRTATDGTYRISLPSGSYFVRVQHPGYLAALRLVALPEDSAEAVQADVTLELLPYVISGQVRDGAGRPAQGAAVQVAACGGAFQTATDATGTYTLPVSAGTYRVEAWVLAWPKPVHSGVRQVSAPPSAVNVDILVESPTYYTVRGRVTDAEGWPIENAHVRTLSGAPDFGYASTDAAGAYALTLRAGSYLIEAAKDGYVTSTPISVTTPPSQDGVDFTLSPASLGQAGSVTVRGMVRAASGEPVAGASVCFATTGERPASSCRWTYYDGTYIMSLAPGAYHASAQAGCHTLSGEQQVTVLAIGAQVDFTLRRLDSLVTGQVTDVLGRPVCGANISPGDVSLHGTGAGREGLYYLLLPAGTYTITASQPGYGSAPSQMVRTPPHIAGVDFVLPLPPNTIQGSVCDPHGAAVAGATVEVDGPAQMEPTATDANGAYTLYVPDGAWQVTVSRPGYTGFPPREPAGVPPSPAQVDFVLVPNREVRWRYLPLLLQMPAQQQKN